MAQVFDTFQSPVITIEENEITKEKKRRREYIQ